MFSVLQSTVSQPSKLYKINIDEFILKVTNVNILYSYKFNVLHITYNTCEKRCGVQKQKVLIQKDLIGALNGVNGKLGKNTS